MYRSGGEPAEPAPVALQTVWPSPRPIDDDPWAPADPAPRREYALILPDVVSPAVGMVEAGLLVMTFPVAMTAAMMVAPVLWMLNATRRR